MLTFRRILSCNYTLLSIILLILVIFCIRAPFPSDDLLRDVIIGKYGFNYSNLYIYAPRITPYNQYIGFDKILFMLVQHVGQIWTVRVVQVTCILGYIIALVLIFNKLLDSHPDKQELIVLLVTYTIIAPIMSRLILGRPEVIFTIWALFGVACGLYKNHIASIAWIFIGICLIPLYWLGFLYLPVTFLLFNKHYVKTMVFIIMMALYLFSWQILSNYEWLSSLLLWFHNIFDRIPEVTVNENNTIFSMVLIPQVGIVLFMLSYKFQKNFTINWRRCSFMKVVKHKYTCLLLLCIWFCMPNMIRYIDIVFPLIMVIAVDQFKGVKLSLDKVVYKNFITIISVYLVIMAQSMPTIKPPKFNLPANAKVLASFDGANYYVPFFAKEKIQIAPSMEIGANEYEIQQLIVDIQKNNNVNCVSLKKYNFNYLVEKSLTSIPNCLRLVQVQGAYRLWKIQ